MAIALVQSKAADTTTSTTAQSLAITLDSPTTAGNVVIVTISTVTIRFLKVTSAHGVFAEITPQTFENTTATMTVRIYMGIMFGADTVITIADTAVANTMAPCAAVAVEYSGQNITLDKSIPSTATGSGVGSGTTGALTNTDANALFVGAIGVKCQSATENTAWATSVTSPFLITAQTTTNTNTAATSDRAIAFCGAIVSTASARTANVAHGLGTLRYAGVLTAFHEIPSGGGIRTAGHGGLAA